MPKQKAPTSKNTINFIEFRKVATPWVAFIAEEPNDIAGQNADPDGTIEDSVDISDPNYSEAKTRIIEVHYAEEDHLEPPVYINTLDDIIDHAKKPTGRVLHIPVEDKDDDTNQTLEDAPDNSDPSQAAALLDVAEIYEPHTENPHIEQPHSKNRKKPHPKKPQSQKSKPKRSKKS